MILTTLLVTTLSLLSHVDVCISGLLEFEKSCTDLGEEKLNVIVNAAIQAKKIGRVAAEDLEKQQRWAELMHDSMLPEDNYRQTIGASTSGDSRHATALIIYSLFMLTSSDYQTDYFMDIAELGSEQSPWVVRHQCDVNEEHLEDVNGEWSDATWKDEDGNEVLDDEGQPEKMVSEQDLDQARRPLKPCEERGCVAYIEMGHGRFEHVTHVQICQLFWDDKGLDERRADDIIQQGILSEPYRNVLDSIYPKELRLFHEYMHIVGGLNKTETSRRPDNKLGITLIEDGVYDFRGCDSWVKEGWDTRYVADCYRVTAEGIYLQIEVDRFGHENTVPTMWHKGIIDRETMTGPTSREDKFRLWDIERDASGHHQPHRLSTIIEEEEEEEEKEEEGESCDAESSGEEQPSSESESEEERPDARKQRRWPFKRPNIANRRRKALRAAKVRRA